MMPYKGNTIIKRNITFTSPQAPDLGELMSVVTAVHNEERYIRRVVESVAAQTVPVLEHIIIDDGSTDHSAEILHELQQQVPHLVVLSQACAGAAAARNRGIDIARGRYIAFLDADDTWSRSKAEQQLRFMETHRCVFSFGDYDEVCHTTLKRRKRYQLPERVGHRQLLRGCPIGCLTVAYNQEVLGKRHMPTVRSGHDWGLWLDLTRDGTRARKYTGVLASYTNGRSSLSSRKLSKTINVYRIYRSSEKLNRPGAILHTVAHVLSAAAKKLRLIYAPHARRTTIKADHGRHEHTRCNNRSRGS